MSNKVRFESAPQDKVEELQCWIDQVLIATGHPEAYVTDESRISDFMSMFEEDREKRAKEIGNKLGVSVSPKDYIFEVAERLRDKKNIAGLGND